MLLLHQRSIFFYSSPSSQSNRYLEVRFLLIYFDLFGVKSLQACVPHIRYILISPRKFNKHPTSFVTGNFKFQCYFHPWPLLTTMMNTHQNSKSKNHRKWQLGQCCFQTHCLQHVKALIFSWFMK
ncbi:hypothetical protein HanHA89_Chr04g0155021 [Helianthus annuus]|nr:hypothetical protein HanHA89_Chr04g0155021 [Helianthus annuus]